LIRSDAKKFRDFEFRHKTNSEISEAKLKRRIAKFMALESQSHSRFLEALMVAMCAITSRLLDAISFSNIKSLDANDEQCKHTSDSKHIKTLHCNSGCTLAMSCSQGFSHCWQRRVRVDSC